MEAVNFGGFVEWSRILQRMMISLSLGPAVVLMKFAMLFFLHFVGSDLHILGEYLFEGLQLSHVFGFGADCGGVRESG